MRDDLEENMDVGTPADELRQEEKANEKLEAVEFTYEGVDFSKLKQAIDCWKQGMVDREVSEELDIPMVYVSSIRNFLGLKANWKHVSTRTRRLAAKAMQEKGLDAAEIAKVLKVHASLVKTWLETDE